MIKKTRLDLRVTANRRRTLVGLVSSVGLFLGVLGLLSGAQPQVQEARAERQGHVFHAADIVPEYIGEPALATPRVGEVGSQNVLGADERVQVTNTSAFPFSAIVFLGLYDDLGFFVGHCSGTIVGPNSVLTAAHCLYDETGWVRDIRVVPGRNGAAEPFGFQWGVDWWVPDEWYANPGDVEFDWGIITLADSALSTMAGSFNIASHLTSTLQRPDYQPAMIGYPGDKSLGTMWMGAKPAFLSATDTHLLHEIDTFSGQSGSAIFSVNFDQYFLGYISAIHTNGATSFNFGRRVTSEVIQDLTWACSLMGCTVNLFTEQPAAATPTATHTPTKTVSAPSPGATPTSTATKPPPPSGARKKVVAPAVAADSASGNGQPAPTSTKTPTRTPTAGPPAAVTPTGTPTSAFITFGDGFWVAGVQISAGTYRTRDGIDGCFWGWSGFPQAVSRLGIGPQVVKLAPNDIFRTSSCGQWSNDLSPVTASPTAPFGQGTYIVGTDIAPGTWRAPGGSSCHWARLKGFRGLPSEVIASGSNTWLPTVSVSPLDVGFESSNCGTWAKIG